MNILTLSETAKLLGLSTSYLYKMTHRRLIPYYKPLGKKCYFDRNEVEEWVKSRRISTDAELEAQAISISNNKTGGISPRRKSS